ATLTNELSCMLMVIQPAWYNSALRSHFGSFYARIVAYFGSILYWRRLGFARDFFLSYDGTVIEFRSISNHLLLYIW
ncbi:MAG: hypothetical protein U1A25_03235, partial [Candidatus Sungbacteria bacterium]|nr:hypothetical protein [Candidatus Sungbacteria bacterium]